MSEFYFVAETIQSYNDCLRVGGRLFGKLECGQNMALYEGSDNVEGKWVYKSAFLCLREVQEILVGESSQTYAEDEYVDVLLKKIEEPIEVLEMVGVDESMLKTEKNPYLEGIFLWLKYRSQSQIEPSILKEQAQDLQEKEELLKRFIIPNSVYSSDFFIAEKFSEEVDWDQQDEEQLLEEEYESIFYQLLLPNGREALALFTTEQYLENWLRESDSGDFDSISEMPFDEILTLITDLEEVDMENPAFDSLLVVDPGQPHSFVLDESYMKRILFVHFQSLYFENEERKKRIQEEMKKVQAQTEGYINPNWQKNIGKTEVEAGMREMGKGGVFYNLECLFCGNVYSVRSSSLKIKKCPHCQGGKA